MSQRNKEGVYKVIFTKKFLKDTKKLQKKFKNIDRDLLQFVTSLESGKVISDRIQGMEGYSVYKARMRNSFVLSGKSGGFRIIYYMQYQSHIYCLTIYSKSEKKDVSRKEILEILNDL